MAWPPTVDDLRQEVETTRNDASLHRILQAAVNVVTLYGLDEAVSENHALQLAVVDVQFDALRMESKGSAQTVKEHIRARNGVLIELSRLRTNAARGSSSGAAPVVGPVVVPDPAAAPSGTDAVLYLDYDAWRLRTHSTTPPKRADGQIDEARVTALLTDAALRCVQWIPSTLSRGGRQIPLTGVSLVLFGACRDVCRDLVDHWLSPRSEKWREDCAACEERSADRLRAVARAVA